MVVVEVLDLLKLVRELVGRKSELDRMYFEDFVQPIWDTFLEIHKNYKDSFQKYIDLLLLGDDEKISAEELVSQLFQDSTYTADLRSELGNLIKNLPSSRFKARRDHLIDFLEAVVGYFDSKGKPIYRFAQQLHQYNPPRYQAVIYISRKGDNFLTEETIKMFEELLKVLQFRYGEVSNTYHQLRKVFLM